MAARRACLRPVDTCRDLSIPSTEDCPRRADPPAAERPKTTRYHARLRGCQKYPRLISCGPETGKSKCLE